jgi:peptide/nickel transport system substrate-binding protein
MIKDKLISFRLLSCYLILVLIIFVIFRSTHCGRGDEQTKADPSTITVLYPVDEWGLGPAWSWPSQFLVFLPLVTRNAEGKLESRLADSWKHSHDYRTWTIRLRSDVKWHDGVPVTAHDIKFTLDLLSKVANPFGLQLESYSTTILNDHMYTITYHKRGAVSPPDYYNVYYPKHLLKDLDPKKFYEWEFWKNPIGNGPYRYIRTVPGTMIELEANPDYFRGKPKIERVILKFGESSLTELLSGNVDALVHVNQMDLMKLSADHRFQIYNGINPYRDKALAWNQNCPLFQDSMVRQALTMAIDRRELHKLLYLPDGLPIFDVIFTVRQFWRGELLEPLPYDPKRAKELLEQAGWHEVDGKEIREKEGKAFRFKVLISQGGAMARGGKSVAIYIQDQLRRVGVQMEIEAMENLAARARVFSGDFEAAIYDITYLTHRMFFGENSPIGYIKPSVIESLHKAMGSMDPDEEDRNYRELMLTFKEDLPVTFLYPHVSTTIIHRRIRGLSSPFRDDPVWYMEDLWIEDEK